jgi:predicted nucleotidyltransferase
MRRIGGLALALALAGCGGTWIKAGVSPEAAARDLSECRHVAEIANRRDSDIDQDILASRGQDWEKFSVIQNKRDQYADSNERRTGDIVDRCMIAKGYSPNS